MKGSHCFFLFAAKDSEKLVFSFRGVRGVGKKDKVFPNFLIIKYNW